MPALKYTLDSILQIVTFHIGCMVVGYSLLRVGLERVMEL